jgi:dihydroorotase
MLVLNQAKQFSWMIRDATVVTPNGPEVTDLGIVETPTGGKIAAIGSLAHAEAQNTLLAKGLHLLPGVIDTQVHFREPGNTHKEDIASGTLAAVKGGVTTVLEMPNTSPPTTTEADLQFKIERAQATAHCNIQFYVGATPHNIQDLGRLEQLPGCCGTKIFMGSSTGNLLVSDDDTLLRVLKAGRGPVAIHAEDDDRLTERKPLAEAEGHPRAHPLWRDAETALKATQRIVRLARQADRRIHILHVTTADEVAFLAQNKDIASFEIPPQHLTLAAPECYERLGTLAQMNPPIREQHHQDALWQAIRLGIADVIGTDHAPHTLDEKAQPYPQSPSGMPGVQTVIPVMLTHVNAGRLTLARFVDLMCTRPAHLFNLHTKGRIALGYDADLTLVDLSAKRTMSNDWIASKCGWTPYDGMPVTAWPMATFVMGRQAHAE